MPTSDADDRRLYTLCLRMGASKLDAGDADGRRLKHVHLGYMCQLAFEPGSAALMVAKGITVPLKE